MTITQRTTVVGVFTEISQANRAIEALHRAGFTNEQIGFVARHSGNMVGSAVSSAYAPDAVTAGESSPQAEATAAGALSGGVLGGIVGAAAALLIPGLGLAIAGGIFIATLGGIAIGAVAGGLIGALTSMGIPEEEARYYQDELHAGRIIVTVNAGNRIAEALAILRENGAYDATTQSVATATTQPSAPYGEMMYPEAQGAARPVAPTTPPSAVRNMQYETYPPQEARPESYYTPDQPHRAGRRDFQPSVERNPEEPSRAERGDIRPSVERNPEEAPRRERLDSQLPMERNPEEPSRAERGDIRPSVERNPEEAPRRERRDPQPPVERNPEEVSRAERSDIQPSVERNPDKPPDTQKS